MARKIPIDKYNLVKPGGTKGWYVELKEKEKNMNIVDTLVDAVEQV